MHFYGALIIHMHQNNAKMSINLITRSHNALVILISTRWHGLCM